MSGAFRFSSSPIDLPAEREAVADAACGGFASFEGWVREQNDGRPVRSLEYEAYVALAVREGERIVEEARRRFGVRHVRCVHRVGHLELGEVAVWVGASAAHRAEAFAACRFVIDEVKHRVPIWKKEHYVSGDSGWVNCERCAQPHVHEGERDHAHDHAHDDVQPTAGRQGTLVDYSRQVKLREVGTHGQQKLRRARVLVIGAGGLGVPVLGYLAGAGVGVLGVMDGDVLEASNLHRQTIYTLAEVGRPKALLAAQRLRALNPEVDVRAHTERAERASLAALIGGYDVVVDCTDNFATTYAIHDAAREAQVHAVYASVYQFEGQLQVVRAKERGSCIRCVWDLATPDGVVGNCAEAGVLGPVPGVLGSLQALETLKLILDLPGALRDEVAIIDLSSLAVRRIRAPRRAECSGGCVRVPSGDAAPADLELAFESLAQVPAAGYELIDIREPDEVLAQPVAIPTRQLTVASLLDAPDRLPAGRDVVLMCARGSRSRGAATMLRAQGYTRVWSLAGGLNAYLAPAPVPHGAPFVQRR